jgi:hypothetical protein
LLAADLVRHFEDRVAAMTHAEVKNEQNCSLAGNA